MVVNFEIKEEVGDKEICISYEHEWQISKVLVRCWATMGYYKSFLA